MREIHLVFRLDCESETQYADVCDELVIEDFITLTGNTSDSELTIIDTGEAHKKA